VRRLETRKRVRRRPNPDDGRSSLFELTASGDREWHLGWGALQRISALLARNLDMEDSHASLLRLNDAFAAALTDD
jgi:DNA-binding MarR family transcriptional regulator